MSSIAAKELAMKLDFCLVDLGLEYAELTEEAQRDVDVAASKIQAAVAPLVALANYAGHRMTCRRMEFGGKSGAHCDCGFDEAEKALAQWSNEDGE